MGKIDKNFGLNTPLVLFSLMETKCRKCEETRHFSTPQKFQADTRIQNRIFLGIQVQKSAKDGGALGHLFGK